MLNIARSWAGVAFCIAACASAACAGHAARTQNARQALDRGDAKQALAELNKQLKVKQASELPSSLKKDMALFVLDRATVLQQLRQYLFSSRDLEAADKQIELLDFSQRGVQALGRYLFSDDVGPYKAPAYEKVMINTLNMVNYLVRGDLSGARVEARRFAVMVKHLKDESQVAHAASLGNYVAGFVFEKSGQPDEAQRYYKDATDDSGATTLQPTVCDATQGCGDLLVVIAYGRVPPKEARRMPIGLALTFASPFLAAADVSKAGYLAGQGLVTWVNFPQLGKAVGTYGMPSLQIDGRAVATRVLLQVDAEAAKAWNQVKGKTIAAAIVRTIVRAAAGEGVRRAAGGGWAGALISLGGQAALAARDTPDTRSWSTLPARIAVARLQLPAGSHRIVLRTRGVVEERTVNLKAGGWAMINATSLR